MTFIENPIYVLAVLCLMVLLSMQAAKTKLGDKFDIREFHGVVLNNGAVPLNILED